MILQVVKGTDFGAREAWVRVPVPAPGLGDFISVTSRGGSTSPEPQSPHPGCGDNHSTCLLNLL